MKRIVFFVLVMALAIVFAGANPSVAANDHAQKTAFRDLGDVTVDSQITALGWDKVATYIFVKDTAGTCVWELSGIAKLYAYDILYVGMTIDSTLQAVTCKPTSCPDTGRVGGFVGIQAPIWMPFTFYYADSSAARTDTMFIDMATGNKNKPILVKNLTIHRQ